MAQMSKWMVLMRTLLASVLALSVSSPTRSDAQSQSAASNAYRSAVQKGTVGALEQFIERYPLSPEASIAFCDVVLLSRDSSLANRGPSGLFASKISRGISACNPY